MRAPSSSRSSRRLATGRPGPSGRSMARSTVCKAKAFGAIPPGCRNWPASAVNALSPSESICRAEPGTMANPSGSPTWLRQSPRPETWRPLCRPAQCLCPAHHSGREVLGVFEFFGRDVCSPDDRILQALAEIANQIGQYMERKRLEDHYRQSQKMEAVAAGRRRGPRLQQPAHRHHRLRRAAAGRSCRPAIRCAASVERSTRPAQRAAALTRQLLAFSRKQVLAAARCST